jgi:CRP/FNR family transcriptional regulator, cyclic AMP receptor protein
MTMYLVSSKTRTTYGEAVPTAHSGVFFRSLSPEALAELGSMAANFKCAARTQLYSEEEIPTKVFILLEGQVKVGISARNGKHLILRIAKPGELLGLSSAFSGNLYEETAETIGPCSLMTVCCTQFGRFLTRHPSAFQAVMREIGVQYELACSRLRVTGLSLSVASRLARLLLEWSADGQATEYGTRMHVPLTHGEIGECIGTCRESVTRILGDLQRRQIVNVRGSILTVTDRSALELCAGI